MSINECKSVCVSVILPYACMLIVKTLNDRTHKKNGTIQIR